MISQIDQGTYSVPPQWGVETILRRTSNKQRFELSRKKFFGHDRKSQADQAKRLPDQLKLDELRAEQGKRPAAVEESLKSENVLKQDGQSVTGQEFGRQILSTGSPNFRAREMKWVSAHRSEYAGQWVVVEGDRLIAHGSNPLDLYREARQAGIPVPFLVEVEPEDQIPFGGW